MRIVFENKDFFSTSEAAKMIGITRMTLHRWIAVGKITAVKIGRYRAIHTGEIERVKGDKYKRIKPTRKCEG